METKTKNLAPGTNKALFHTLSDVFSQVMNDEMPIEKANALCNIASKMQKSLELEISRFKAHNLAGKTDAKFREIELIALDNKQIGETDTDILEKNNQ